MTHSVDLVLPISNSAQFLDDCIAAVLAQEFRDIRLHVLDNASSDTGPEIVAAWQRKDERVSYEYIADKLGHVALERRMDAIGNAPYVLIMSPADLLGPGLVGALHSALVARDECSLAYCNWDYLGDPMHDEQSGQTWKPAIPHRDSGYYDDSAHVMLANWVPTSFTLMRRHALQLCGGVNPTSFEVMADHFRFARMAAAGSCYYHAVPLGSSRRHVDLERNRLIQAGQEAFERIRFHDMIFERDALWSLPQRLFAKVAQQFWLSGTKLLAAMDGLFKGAHPQVAAHYSAARQPLRRIVAQVAMDWQPCGLPVEDPKFIDEFVAELMGTDSDDPVLSKAVAQWYDRRAEEGLDAVIGELVPTRGLQEAMWYRSWWMSRIPAAGEMALMRAQVAAWSQRPVIQFACVLLPHAQERLQQTIATLQCQLWADWRLTVVSFEPRGGGVLRDERVQWLELGDDDDSLDALNAVLGQAKADWVGLIEAGDTLENDALFKLMWAARQDDQAGVIYSDEDELSAEGRCHSPRFKPDFDIDWLRVAPYIGGLTLIAKSLFTALEGFSARFEGVEEYEFLLRAYEHSGASCFRHVPRMLMHRHEESGHSLCEPSELQALMREAVSAHLARQGLSAKVGIGSQPATLDVEYVAAREPSVAVIIPVDGVAFEIKPLIQWLEHVQYGRLSCHFIGSDKAQIDVLTTELSQCAPAGEWQVRHFIGPWASQVNQAIASIDAELVLLAHGGLSSAGSDWLRRLIGQCLRPGVGVVGCRLVHPDGRLVHAGLTGGVDHQPVFPVEAGLAKGKPGYLQRAYLPHRVLAVDERCMMFSKALFTTLGGFDHVAFPDRYAHVDFCLRSAEHGDTTISDNAVELVLRGVGEVVRFKPSDKVMAEHPEREQMFARWLPTLVRDPSYNVNLRLDDVNASIEPARIYTLGDDWRPAPRIIAFPFDHWGRGLYRIKAPATSMANAGLIQGGWCERIYGPTEIARVRPDAIVVQQQLEGGGYEAIERYKRFGNAFAVFDMDDLINFAPNKELAWSERVSGHIEKKLRRAIGACDRLVVSTPFLAEAYGDFCVEVRVQPNCVELAQWGNFQPRRRQGDKPRIGWAGGNTHIEDLELLDGVIAATWQEVDWIFFGMCPDRLRPYAAEVHSGVAIDAYPTKLASLDLDLAVAPLVDNIFSHAKSALKLLEYGILGYPTICTDITPYQGEFPAWRVQNTTDEWIDAIRAAIADRDALARAGDALRDYVRQHCTLEGNLEAWRASWLPD